jgi:hypothetical protein
MAGTRYLIFAVCLVACGGGGGGGAGDAPEDAARDAAPPARDACPTCLDAYVLHRADAAPGRDAAPEPPPLRDVDQGCSDLFSQVILPTFEIEIDPQEWAALQDDFAHPGDREAMGLPPKPYHPLRKFRYGDEVVNDAMIRLKGNPYFSWVPPKMQFVISFKEVNPKGRFHGLRKLSLDAPWYDRTLLRERLALSFLREAGLPASCANNARLIVNGEYYGLYVNKEQVDKEFLERNFADPEGNLYKYGFELKTNEDEADVARRDALVAAADLPAFEALVDRSQAVAAWAGEAMLPDPDGYWCCNHNFYLYDQPGGGFAWIPYDLDIAFNSEPVAPQPPAVGPIEFSGGQPAQFVLAMADAGWRADFAAAVARMLPAYDPDEFNRRLDAWDAQIGDAFFADPNLPFATAEHGRALQALRAYFRPRREYLEQWVDEQLACQRGEAGRDRDGDGVGACADCGDLDRNVHPGAHDACNQRDDDCDGRIDEDETCADCVPVTVGEAQFSLCAAPETWFDAHGTCARAGGALAVPLDEAARTALAQAAEPLAMEGWWIGANDGGAENHWVDPDGHAIDAPPWGAGRPNGARDQNCAVLEPGEGGAWNDEDCTDLHPVVCALPSQ